jgi:hypothetical protein
MIEATPSSAAASILLLRQRIACAAIECETWRRTGLTEKYIESYDLVEALQADLERHLGRA